MKITKLLTLLFFTAIVFSSCNNDSIDKSKGDYENGLLISGEGSGSGTGFYILHL